MEHLKRTMAKYCYYNNCFVLCLNCRAFLQDWRSVGTGNAWNEETAHAFMGLSVCALELEEGRGREVEGSCHLSAGDMKTNVGTHLGNRKEILGHIRDKGGHSIMLSCQSDHKMFSSFFPQKPNTAPRVSHWRCRGEWGSCVTLTFCRIWTPCCFCPSRASQLHFCCLHVTSSLLLAEYCLSWRDSIRLGGGEERNVKEKPNHQVNAQQTAVVQFQMGTSSLCRSPQGNIWVDLNEENGHHHLALLFLTEQEHSTSSRGRWGSCCCWCPWGCAFRGQPAVDGWQYPKGMLTVCRVHCFSGCLTSMSLSA